MHLSGVAEGIKQVWEDRPGIIILLIAVFGVFVFLVVDVWLLKRKRRVRQRQKRGR